MTEKRLETFKGILAILSLRRCVAAIRRSVPDDLMVDHCSKARPGKAGQAAGLYAQTVANSPKRHAFQSHENSRSIQRHEQGTPRVRHVLNETVGAKPFPGLQEVIVVRGRVAGRVGTRSKLSRLECTDTLAVALPWAERAGILFANHPQSFLWQTTRDVPGQGVPKAAFFHVSKATAARSSFECCTEHDTIRNRGTSMTFGRDLPR
ncbi:hypothetical protein SAMN04488026_108219 [Aliiruegeria lutimaris]|uniref:Uncharacterized protein n=1 Tax=Aliiruegeria lutimaris TaxID=571298 RepID=A0A1G9JP92_9RHOB|nr:hypothetical protein SAMN04488026_108219 [Aliiruegeria lutimaris]